MRRGPASGQDEDEIVRDGDAPGQLLLTGGAEDRCHGAGLLERFAGLCGGGDARIVLVTAATGMPDQVHADYQRAFRKLGVADTRELRLRGRSDADSADALAMVADATGVFVSGGDQSRLRTSWSLTPAPVREPTGSRPAHRQRRRPAAERPTSLSHPAVLPGMAGRRPAGEAVRRPVLP